MIAYKKGSGLAICIDDDSYFFGWEKLDKKKHSIVAMAYDGSDGTYLDYKNWYLRFK